MNEIDAIFILSNYFKRYLNDKAKTMENNGLIERITCDKDSRIKYVKCTDKGKKVYDIAKKNYICLLNKLIDGIDKEDLNAFKKIISKMIENMEEIYD